MSLDLGTLRSRVGGAIGLSTTTGSAELALIDGWINEGVEQYLIETKCKVQEATMDLTAGEGDYTLPVEVLAIKNIWIITADGTRVNLEPVSTEEILERRRYASNVGLFPMVFSLEGFDFLRISPDAGSNSDVLHWDYVPVPATLVDASDVPSEIPRWAHPAIEEYAKWKAADWDDDTSSKVGERYEQGWDKWVKKGKMRLNKASGKWGPARAGRRRSTVPTSPGVDTGI